MRVKISIIRCTILKMKLFAFELAWRIRRRSEIPVLKQPYEVQNSIFGTAVNGIFASLRFVLFTYYTRNSVAVVHVVKLQFVCVCVRMYICIYIYI